MKTPADATRAMTGKSSLEVLGEVLGDSSIVLSDTTFHAHAGMKPDEGIIRGQRVPDHIGLPAPSQ